MKNKMRCISLSVLLSIGLCCGGAVAGTLKTHSMFSSNMVIQRDKPIVVWGWAEPGQKVSVLFGEAKAETTAGGDKGRWEVTFPARPATHTSQKLIVSSGDKTLEMDNIVIGDVWVMNGQSNMAFGLGKVYDSEIEVATSDLPLLREVRISPNECATLQEDIPSTSISSWTVSSPKTAGGYSAIGYAFASRLQRALGIPIGIIDNARGGASIESLVPRQMFKKDPLAAKYLESVEKRMAEFDPEKFVQQAWENDVAKARTKGVAEDKLPKKPTADSLKSWSVPGRSPNDAAACYNGMFGAFKGLNIKGVIFHQGYNNAMGSSSRPKRYRILMKLMVEGWREDFNDKTLPVCNIEFCAGGVSQNSENFECWDRDAASFIRESQRLGLADVKDPEHTEYIPGHDEQIPGLHPVKKLVHGERAARWALKEVYGMKVAWETAELLSAKPEGDKMVLTFDKVVMPDNLSMVLEGFSIADKSGKFYMAHAAYPLVKDAGVWNSPNKNGDATKILVWSPLVKEPVAVRYAWARSPMGNLKIGGKPWQPLQGFRTDQWDWPESDDPETEVLDRTKVKEINEDANSRCEFRKLEEAKRAVEILERLKTLGKNQPATK